MPTPNCIIKGYLQDFLGNADPGGSMNIVLCNYGANMPKVANIGLLVETQITVNANPADGSFRFPIWGNDVITPGPNQTFYQIQFKNKQGGVVQTAIYQFAGSASEQDLSVLAPLISIPIAVFPPTAVLTNPPGQQKIVGFPLEFGAGFVIDGGSAQISVVGGGGGIGGTVILPQTTGGSDVVVYTALAATLANKTISAGTFTGASIFPAGGGNSLTVNCPMTIANAVTMSSGGFISPVPIFGATSGQVNLAVPAVVGGNFTMNIPALNDTLVSLTATQTLSNKTCSGLTVSAGTVLTADQVMPANSAGFGGFFSPSIFPSFADTASSGTITGVANQVTVTQIVLPFACTVGTIVTQISVAGTAGTLDIGIYSSNGNTKLLSIGGTAIGGAQTGVVSVSISPVFLPAGVYLVACTYSNGTGPTFPTNNTPFATTLMNTNGKRRSTAANAATAGVLPATLGTLTNNAINTIQIWFER